MRPLAIPTYDMEPEELFQLLNRNSSLTIIDVRPYSEYQEEHIPGAIHMPFGRINKQSTRDLDRTSTYICYGERGRNKDTLKGIINLLMLGFSTLELSGGFEQWKKKGLCTESYFKAGEVA